MSIDSCLNNVTQNDAWCFSNRLAEYASRVDYPKTDISFRSICQEQQQQQRTRTTIADSHSIQSKQHHATQSHSAFTHRVCFLQNIHFTTSAIVHEYKLKHGTNTTTTTTTTITASTATMPMMTPTKGICSPCSESIHSHWERITQNKKKTHTKNTFYAIRTIVRYQPNVTEYSVCFFSLSSSFWILVH